jgi:molybdenum cofactor cytidylyltransferase
MGRPKATLPLPDGTTFLTRIIRTLITAGVDDVVVVAGQALDAVAKDLSESRLPARLVVNPNFEDGQLTSITAGLGVVDRPGTRAALIALVDVPLVQPATVRAVIDRYRMTGAAVVRPTSGARHGHPLLIDRSLFPLLRRADPSAGAKPVIRAHASRQGDFEVDDEGAFTDIDTPEDYARLFPNAPSLRG